jgi:DNA-binding response OmpR family regulator
MAERVLVVQDEPALADALASNLRGLGYDVLTAEKVAAAMERARTDSPDLVVLDFVLPRADGLTLCRSLRQISQVPIMILAEQADEVNKILGLESGADDYLEKPFSLGELQARIKALLRRAAPSETGNRMRAGDLTLNLVNRRASVAGRELALSPKEFSLLAQLMRYQGAVLPRGVLLDRVWGDQYDGDGRTLDVHVRWLREKIEVDPAHPLRILTVRGVGYRFEG